MCPSIRLICCSTLFFIVSASADPIKGNPVAADTPDKFAQTIIEIHREMDSSGESWLIGSVCVDSKCRSGQ
jgi:hypothetical protein